MWMVSSISPSFHYKFDFSLLLAASVQEKVLVSLWRAQLFQAWSMDRLLSLLWLVTVDSGFCKRRYI